MGIIKKSWKKEEKSNEIPIEVMDRIAAGGSFVVIKSDRLFKERGEKKEKKEDNKIKSVDELLNEHIAETYFKSWMENIGNNLLDIWKYENNDISNLPRYKSNTAIIVGAGPSFKEKKHIELLKTVKNAIIIATERMLIPLLKEGIEPDLVVNVDGNRDLIKPFYDSPLVSKDIKTLSVMSITVSNNVIKQFPGKIYYYTPMFDNIDNTISLSNGLSILTDSSILLTGSNVGITSINLAYYLGFKNIILIGLDFGYSSNTPIRESSYFKIIRDVLPDITEEEYEKTYVIRGYNPDFNVDYFTNIAWVGNIQNMVEQSDIMIEKGVKLINATEGGALFGGKIIGIKFKEALKEYDKI